jgi:hypothetical protein
MSHMSSNDEISPVTKPLIDYQVWIDGVPIPMRVTCDDIAEKDGYVRFMDGEVPAAIVPIGRLAAANRITPKETAQ